MSKFITDYKTLVEKAQTLCDGVPYQVSNLSNLAALLYETLEEINWAGFYISRGDQLVLGPFQGRPACILIPYGRGVCGTAAQKDTAQLVPDVHKFPGHIACDLASRSEIVIPIHENGKVWGVLDIDSAIPERFDEADRAGLESFARFIEKNLGLWFE